MKNKTHEEKSHFVLLILSVNHVKSNTTIMFLTITAKKINLTK